MSTIVIKFGGTSVGSIKALQLSKSIILQQNDNWDDVVIIVSAMSGVTNALIEGVRTASTGDRETYQKIVDQLREKHHAVINSIELEKPQESQLISDIDGIINRYESFCLSVSVLKEVSARSMDVITSHGEMMNARIMAALLNRFGVASQAVDATNLIITDNTFQNAVPLMERTRIQVNEQLRPMLVENIIPVITGFIGATLDGITTTLGRGGSDFSAAIIANCLQADEVWTMTDVDGVMSADPRYITEAEAIPELSYSEVGELAYFGAKILHPRTIRPVIEGNIPLWVKNTFNPDAPGTVIVSEPSSTTGMVKAITAITGMSMVTVAGSGMLGVPGIAGRTFAAVARQGASVLMISQSSSEQSICFIIPSESADGVVNALEEELALELNRRDIENVWCEDKVVIVTAVGAGMRTTPGVAAKIFAALGVANINVLVIAQGSSECSLSIVIKSADVPTAMNSIHEEVIINSK